MEPLFLDRENSATALQLVDQLVAFLSDPAEVSQAVYQFKGLYMAPTERFWNFYRVFRTVAAAAQITDDATLRSELRDKITHKLRSKLYQEWPRCTTLDEWVERIQNEDVGQHAESTLYSQAPYSQPRASRTQPASKETYGTSRQAVRSSMATTKPPPETAPSYPRHHTPGFSSGSQQPKAPDDRRKTPAADHRTPGPPERSASQYPARINKLEPQTDYHGPEDPTQPAYPLEDSDDEPPAAYFNAPEPSSRAKEEA